MLGAAAATTTPPFSSQQLEFLQQILAEYQMTHADWRRVWFEGFDLEYLDPDQPDWVDFYLMLFTDQALGENETGTGVGAPVAGSGGTTQNDGGIEVPPVADPRARP